MKPDKRGDSGKIAKLFAVGTLIFLLTGIVFSQLPKKSPYYAHYYFLSRSLLQGKLDVTSQLKTAFDTPQKMDNVFDYAKYEDKYYLHLGVFPALVGIPFLVFGLEGYQTTLVIFFLIATIILLTKLGNHFLGKDGFLICLIFIVSSSLLTTLVWRGPWYQTGLMITTWGLLFLWQYVVLKHYWAVILILPLFLTRPTTIFYSFFPFLDLIKDINQKETKKKIFIFTLTLFSSLALFFGYNYLRFGKVWETGYKYTIVPQEEFTKFRTGKSFSQNYLISNVIYLFFNPPRPYLDRAIKFVFPYFELSRFGVGLLFSIPWFLIYLWGNHKKIRDWPYLLVILLILLAVLSFGGEGSFQIGPRYGCDFLPIIIFITLKWLSKNRKQIPNFNKLLVISFFLNLYFLFLVHLGHIRRI